MLSKYDREVDRKDTVTSYRDCGSGSVIQLCSMSVVPTPNRRLQPITLSLRRTQTLFKPRHWHDGTVRKVTVGCRVVGFGIISLDI